MGLGLGLVVARSERTVDLFARACFPKMHMGASDLIVLEELRRGSISRSGGGVGLGEARE